MISWSWAMAKVSRFDGVTSMALAGVGADAPVFKWGGGSELEAFPAEPSLWNTRLGPGVVGMCCVGRSARTVCPKCQWKDSQRKGWSMEFKNRLWVQVCKSYGENYFPFFNFTLKGGKEFYFFSSGSIPLKFLLHLVWKSEERLTIKHCMEKTWKLKLAELQMKSQDSYQVCGT